MENFNAKKYRDSFAKDLKEIRKTDPEKAQEVLSEAQETSEYKYSRQQKIKERNLKNFDKEARKDGKTTLPYFDRNQKLYGLAMSYRMIDNPMTIGDKISDLTNEYINLLKSDSSFSNKNEFPKIEELFDISDEDPETIEKINLAIDKLNQVLKNKGSETYIKDLGESLNELASFFAPITSHADWQTGRYVNNDETWVEVKNEIEIKKRKYFESIEKETLEKVVNIIQHAIKLGNVSIHTDSLIKQKVIEKLKEEKEDLENNFYIEDKSYFAAESGWLEELMEQGQVVRLTNMQIMPGNNGYFAVNYFLKKDNTCDVQPESSENDLEKELFEKFTGHTESFEVKIDDVIKMLDSDKKIAQELISQAEKTVEEMGEIEDYRDFISRINL